MKSRTLITALMGALVLTVAAQAAAQSRSTDDSRPAAAGVVNINTATAEQLSLLPGVGPTRAQAIIAARERRPFRSVRELQRVRGIGWSTVQRLRPYLTVSGETTLREAVTMPSRRAER
jgi:competence protein ComEA